MLISHLKNGGKDVSSEKDGNIEILPKEVLMKVNDLEESTNYLIRSKL